MFGLLNVHKPAGVTSRDVVNRVQRLIRPAKVGHAGTLDPLATGVLILCIGPATRLIEYVQRMPKSYTGEFLLGCESDTEDIEGEVRPLPNPNLPTREQLEILLPRFLGRIQQQPPIYSALKVQGQPAYKRARAGEEVALAPRPIDIHDLQIADFAYPKFTLHIHCGSGTYVRSLGRDLARAAGSGAVMSALVRTAIGPFRLSTAVTPQNLTREIIATKLVSPLAAISDLPQRVVTSDELQRLKLGQFLAVTTHPSPNEIAAVTSQGELAAILVPHSSGQLKPALNFSQHLA